MVTDSDDLFKLRPAINKLNTKKKRGIGILSFKGSVCTSNDKKYLLNILKKLSNTIIDEKNLDQTKESICEKILNKLLELEKYATTKDNNKKTYIIIPYNHPKYIFPYNLEDRILYIINKINKIIGNKIEHKIIKKKLEYTILINNDKNIKLADYILNKYNFNLINNYYTTIIS
jgi:hypothetical protein